ncbi:MAG TPA: hypothetical protein VGH33_19830 [Isosphaeraceae bacterium]|jgi:hypothetical protein
MHDNDKAVVPLGPRPIDANGRLLPISEEERKARSERFQAMLKELETMRGPTDTEERWREFMRGIDEGRPERPLFKGQY